jgi:pimeloyl-ACP methyl ester carboxylesterase
VSPVQQVTLLSMQHTAPMAASPVLSFISINESTPKTILLIHGAYSSRQEWSLVSNYLTSYHLIIPDLPSHGRGSSAKIRFSVADSADLLGDLITRNAHNGHASIAGLSLGGYVAMNLASRYPDLVDALFVSGCHISWEGPWKSWFMGHVMAMSVSLIPMLPKNWFTYLAGRQGLQVPEALYEDIIATCQYSLGLCVAKSIGEDSPPGLLENVKARTLLVVGGNEFGAGQAGEKAQLLRKGNVQSRGFRVEGKEHAWDLQDPKLFAEGIMAWIGEREMPKEFVSLEQGQ